MPAGILPTIPGLVASAPVAPAVSAVLSVSGGLPAGVAGGTLVYVSLSPGSMPAGVVATILNRATGLSIMTPVVDGGFDPTGIVANAGDTLAVEITRIAPDEPVRAFEVVSATRRPVVVRTSPPPRRRDVPLNSRILVVFSAPIDAATLTPSAVQLFRGPSPVPGTVRLTDGSGLQAEFVPENLLAETTDYQLVVAQTIRDVNGESLASPVSMAFTTGTTMTGALATITILPESVEVRFGVQTWFRATGRDAAGNIVSIAPSWSVVAGGGTIDGVQGSTMDSVPDMHSWGLFTARTPGVFAHTVQASSGTISATATVVVLSDTLLANITITPGAITLPVNGSRQFTAIGRDYGGRVVTISPIWSVSGVGGTISNTGLFTAGTVPGLYQWSVEATAGGRVGYATVAVTDPAAGQTYGAVSAGGQHTCAATQNGVPYCWGDNSQGALGTGTTGSSAAPVAVSTGRPFFTVSAGGSHTCGTSPSSWMDMYVTYCWGAGVLGQLGDGTATDRMGPQLLDSSSISGALVSAGLYHTCNLDLWVSTESHCWGENVRGQLGDGTTFARPSPRLTLNLTGSRFEEIITGGHHTCAQAGGSAFLSHLWYCWGANDHGQLGDGSTTDRPRPVLAGGGMSFGYGTYAHGGVSGGARHTCGVSNVGAAFCWGDNSSGQLGDGTTADRSSPVPVVGGLSFVMVSAGGDHTCGLTTAGAVYCWGLNNRGQLGDGTTTNRTGPVPVAGGLSFTSSGFNFRALTLSAGLAHTCGITTSGALYCWGSNGSGQLGNGTTTDSAVPVRVAAAQ